MRAYSTRFARHALMVACVGFGGGPARAGFDELLDFDAPGRWRLAYGPYTQHLHDRPEYQYVWAVAIERQRDDQWMYGASYFSNSFGQACGYLYLGSQFRSLFDVRELYVQWTAGVLYGYKGEYQNEVPLNQGGFSPGFVLSIGWQFDKRFAAQINRVGTAGVMLQLSYTFE